MNWSKLLNALLLVRLGQELGTEGPLAGAVHRLICVLLGL